MLARAKRDNLDLTLLRAAVVDNRPQWGMRRGYVYANTDGTRPYTRFFHMRSDGKVQESTVETRKIIESEPFVTNTPSEQLRLAKIAQSHAGETHCEGDPGFCDPLQAQWEETTLPPTGFDAFADQQVASKWIEEEIQMDESEQLGRGWARLMREDIREQIVAIERDGVIYIWDGHHRAAACIATGRPVPAILGRPFDSQSARHRDTDRG